VAVASHRLRSCARRPALGGSPSPKGAVSRLGMARGRREIIALRIRLFSALK
jgi:hypothetical protein